MSAILKKLHIGYLAAPIQAVLEWLTLAICIGAYALANNNKKEFATLLVITWSQICLLLPYARWFCQNWIINRCINNPAYLVSMNYICNIGRVPFGGELAAVVSDSYIPEKIQTKYEFAREFLQACQQRPFIWTISTTFIDWNTLKFAWLKVHRHALKNIEEHLIPGDMILYHNQKSMLGKLIRLFTKNYWEHAAFYIGNGKVLDIAPGGIQHVEIKNWTKNEDVELAIIRRDNVDLSLINTDKIRGYNYFGVVKEFFNLINKQREAILPITTLVSTTAVVTLLIFILFIFGNFRLILIFSFLICLFLIHQSKSRVAYMFLKPNPREILNEKP